MRYAANTVWSRESTITPKVISVLFGILLVGCATESMLGRPGGASPSWTIEADLDWYTAETRTLGVDYSMIPAFLSAALRDRDFLASVMVLEMKSVDCTSWGTYVSVNIEAEENKIIFLCGKVGEWTIADGVGEWVVKGVPEFIPEVWLESAASNQMIGMPCRPIFDSSVEYLAVQYQGQIYRQAIYAREVARADCEDEGRAAKVGFVFNDVHNAIKQVVGRQNAVKQID